jgi:hypothetical protein
MRGVLIAKVGVADLSNCYLREYLGTGYKGEQENCYQTWQRGLSEMYWLHEQSRSRKIQSGCLEQERISQGWCRQQARIGSGGRNAQARRF